MEPKDLLDKNRRLFHKMEELAIKQERCISEDQVFEFLKLSDRREQVKREISKNNERYGSIIKKGPARGPKTSHDMLNREISHVIQSIQEVDRRVEKILLEKRDHLVREAQALKRGKRAVKGYGKKGSDIPRFLSRKG